MGIQPGPDQAFQPKGPAYLCLVQFLARFTVDRTCLHVSFAILKPSTSAKVAFPFVSQVRGDERRQGEGLQGVWSGDI